MDMIYDFEMIAGFYARYAAKAAAGRNILKRPLTLAEKILYAHMQVLPEAPYRRGADYALFSPDRVAMQDATAQMALLQLMNAGREQVAVPSSVHCDHLICACDGAEKDLPVAREQNREVYDFLRSVAARYGIGFWEAGAGIIHQVVLENYAFPGGMIIGTDSHTPNAGGLGMVAVGVGGADAVDVMAGMGWELKMPRIIGVKLTGQLQGWAAPKDVILHLAGILTVKGGTNAIFEYFGSGTRSLSCAGKATICNMGAEVGATCSVFPYDERMAAYLIATEREQVAALAQACAGDLKADAEVEECPEKYYDRVIEIDLSTLEPYVNGPFTPDAACPASKMKERVAKEGFPPRVEAALIGSCTNSSYQDLARAAHVAKQAIEAGLTLSGQLLVNPGSEQIRATAERDGILPTLRKAGAVVMTNACGPCIGQWKRKTDDPTKRNSIVTSFNRNFAKRADGNPNTHAFITSPEMAVALAFAGRLDFNPATDSLTTPRGGDFHFDTPYGAELPENFATCEKGYIAPARSDEAPIIAPDSERLQRLAPFPAWDGKDFIGMRLLIKVKGKCTTDHISPAGKWLRFRGHLEYISENMLSGAINAFNSEAGLTLASDGKSLVPVWQAAKAYREEECGSIIVAEENYGEGSSREHAAMEPRFLGVRAILAKSFARIHETNLKKQGVLALTFAHPDDYEHIRENDRLSVTGLATFAPGRPLTLIVCHSDGTEERFSVLHTYNTQQIAWFKAGSALNAMQKS